MPRKDEGHEETEKILKELESRISKEYAKAEKEIAEKLDDYLRRFAIKDEIKRKALEEGKITEAEYKQWLIGQVAIGQRWQEMLNTIAEDFTNTAQIAKSITNGYMPEVYAINHNYGTYQVEQASKVDTSYTLYDRHTVQRLFDDDATFYKKAGRRITAEINEGKQMAWDKKQVQSVMLQGILQGESIGKIATRLARTVGDSDRKAAIRNARTITTGIQNAGRVDSYKRAENMGIQMEQMWLATLDDRTRHEHRLLDGQKVPVGEKFEVDGYEIAYPGDPEAEAFLVYNCRCTLTAALKGFSPDASDLSLRNTNHMSEESYDEWKENHPSYSDPITKQDDIEEAMKREYGREYAELAGTKYVPPSQDDDSYYFEEKSQEKPEPVIPDNVKEIFDVFDKKYRNAKTEHYVAIDKDGNVIYESDTKGKRSVAVPKHIDEQMEGGFSIHNHPAEAVFSADDIKNYEKYGEHGLIVDVTGNEYLLYNLNPVAKYKEVEKAQTEEEFDALMPFYSKVSEVFDKIDSDVLEDRRAYTKELMSSDIDRESRGKMLSEWMKENDPDKKKVKWLEEHAEEYGFIFRKERGK